jgi:hypothetical protein
MKRFGKYWGDNFLKAVEGKELLATLSIYTHKTKPGVFCAICVGAGKESPLQVKEHGWQCAHNEKHWFKNPDYIEPPTVRGSFSAWD